MNIVFRLMGLRVKVREPKHETATMGWNKSNPIYMRSHLSTFSRNDGEG